MANFCVSSLLLVAALIASASAGVTTRRVVGELKGQEARHVVTIADRDYYFSHFDILSWSDARQACLDMSMQLSSFETKEEYDAVATWILQNPSHDFWMWTSGARSADSDTWRWEASDVEVVATEWLAGEPSQPPQLAACLNFSASAGGWGDDACATVMSFLCEQTGN